MGQTYPPLIFLKDAPGNSFQRIHDELAACVTPVASWSETELLRYFTSDLFMMPSGTVRLMGTEWNEEAEARLRARMEKTGMVDVPANLKPLFMTDQRNMETYLKINSVLEDRMRLILSHVHSTGGFAHFDIRAETRDYYLSPILFERWLKNKQVYKLDEDFAYTLISTDSLEMSRYTFAHLPYKSFYVDLSSCKCYFPIIGAFVFVDDFPDRVSISCYLLTDNLVMFSYYGRGYYDANGIAEFNFKDMDIIDYEMTGITEDDLVKMKSMKDYDFSTTRKAMSVLLLQLICYLSQDEPQITESDLTKGTYRPRAEGAPVRNKWSEVHISDVGVRFGNKFRKWKKDMEQAKAGTPHTHHRSPKPHFRSAHWHKYWTGVGRTIPKYNWIEPVFVGYGDTEDTVIHLVEDK